MADNHFIDAGKQAEFTAAAATPAGSVCTVEAGKIYGVNHLPLAAGEVGVVDLTGRFELLKEAVAMDKGDPAYLTTSGTVTSSSTGTTAIGITAEDASSTGTTATIYFNGLIG